jgi:hypothetical protein
MSRTDEMRVKIERAKKHINELDVAYNLFFASRPHEISSKSDPKTGDRVFYTARVDDVPLDFSAIVGDILQNLRSALDHLAYQLFRIGPGGTGDPRHIYFPIFDDAAKYKTGVIGKVKGMRQDAIDAIDTIKPYKGGDETLWRLHALNNLDKHRLLITAVTSYKFHSLTPSQRARIIEGFKGSRPNDPVPNLRGIFTEPTARNMFVKAGDILLTIPESEIEDDLMFRMIIAFGEPGIVEGEPVIETLKAMAERVDNIISDFAIFLL